MKLILLWVLIITSTNLFAYGSRSCPLNLSFTASGIDTNIISDSKLSANLSLTNSSYVKCEYRGQDQNGNYVSAFISRSTQRGSISKGALYINFEDLQLRTKTKLKTISYNKVEIDYSSYRGVKKAVPTTIYSLLLNKVVSITKRHSVRI